MKKTRVAAYCRASRGSAEPEHSLKAQADFYKEMICSTPSFQFAGIHAEIASGLNTKHRSEFRKLLQDCKKSKVEILLPTWIQSHDSLENEPPFEYPLNPLFSNRYGHRKRSEPLTFISCPERLVF